MMRERCKGEFRVATNSIWLTLSAVLMCLAGVLLLPRVLNCRADLNDLSIRAEGILKLSHDVAKVESLVVAPKPTHRIVHIVSRHPLEWKRFEDAARLVCRDTLSEDELHEWHQAHCDEMERFQASQKKLLLWLVDHHGLTKIFREGASEEDMPRVMREVEWFRKIAPWRDRLKRERLRLSQQLREAKISGRDSTALRDKLDEHELSRDYSLNFGPIGDLLLDRPFVTIIPAEDAEAYAAAQPEKHGGRLHGSHYDAREAAIVRNLLKHGPCAVIVLGVAHDLSEEVQKQGHGGCEYIRVTTTNFPPRLDQEIPTRDYPRPSVERYVDERLKRGFAN